MAAFGPLALKQVAGLGLPYLASPIESLEVLADNYQRFRLMAEEAGQPEVDITPVMRTVFVTDDSRQASEVAAVLARTAPSARGATVASVDDWALIGEPTLVRDKLAEYVERLGLTHLIVRAGLAGVTNEQQLRSHEQFVNIVDDL